MNIRKLLRNLSCGAGLAMLILPLSALAQEAPKAEVFAGYSFLRTFVDTGGVGIDGINSHGFNGSIAGNISKNFGIVGDFGFYRASVLDTGINSITYMVGPRISGRSDKVDPFVHALFGGARVSALGASARAFAFALGGGLDIKASDNVAFRIAQVDYLGTRSDGVTENNFRYSVGIVFRIGGR